ncbi:MAG: DUF3592 domain-containing protein [Anaerolineales bacterium]|nr:DUF3592 domain-containing protein [Anaerolineales bacterium]MDW8278209.1 DUF3592 domain-containing protein [Anaerolineales bacterium]
MEQPSSTLLIALFLLCMGGGFFLGAMLVFLMGKPFQAKSEASGTVIALEPDPKEPDIFAPVVRFTAGNGQSYTFKSKISSARPAHQVGQTVSVLYSTAQPQNAEIKGQSQVFILLLGVAGICLLCAAVVVGAAGFASGF